ncbi:unnamed protein product, partial [Nesidiocoris tenuis]
MFGPPIGRKGLVDFNSRSREPPHISARISEREECPIPAVVDMRFYVGNMQVGR